MRSLKEYIDEGLLDRVKNKDVNHEALIKEFLGENYFIDSYEIKTTNNKLVVNVKGNVKVINNDITSLTNGFFEFGEVRGNFDCARCESLKTLEGAPQKIGKDFNCFRCKSLTTLEGCPEKVDGDFYCSHCYKLKSLKGAPKEVGGGFYCRECGIKFSTKDVKKYTTISGVVMS